MPSKLFCLALAVALAGCATSPRPQLPAPSANLPPEARITQRGVLTVLGRQFTLNGYVARSETNGLRLIVTENFGNVLADVLVKPDGQSYVMRSSRAFKPKWIRNFLAADLRCLFGSAAGLDCPGRELSPTHWIIERRWYRLELQTVEVVPGSQDAALFVPPAKVTP